MDKNESELVVESDFESDSDWVIKNEWLHKDFFDFWSKNKKKFSKLCMYEAKIIFTAARMREVVQEINNGVAKHA